MHLEENSMNINNVLDCFFVEIPELKVVYEEKRKENLVDDEDGNYVIWGMGILPGILQLFEEFDLNKALLTKIFGFFEKMAGSDDEEIRELLLYSVLEGLGDDKGILEKAVSIMGKKTLNYSKKVEDFLGR